MNSCDLSNWYAVQTKPNAEECARLALESLALPTFLPRRRSSRQPAESRSPRPIFPNYLFCRFAPAQHLRQVRYSRGVRRVVGVGELPIPVEDAIIDDLSARLDGDGFVQLDEPDWPRGAAVQITSGPLQGWSGIFESELPDHRRVNILLTNIHARMIVERQCLELASAA